EDELRVRGVEIVPERLDGRRRREGAGRRGVEARVEEHRQHALFRGRREVRLEPDLLRRADSGRNECAVAVQRDDVPRAEVVAVVALTGRACSGAEVVEVTRGRGARVVLVVSDGRIRARLMATPRGVIAGEVG